MFALRQCPVLATNAQISMAALDQVLPVHATGVAPDDLFLQLHSSQDQLRPQWPTPASTLAMALMARIRS